ncbi:hypothetical protein LUZ60_015671 [Juncus effusus]|nr:hypothetical protein LUZ60_015671 [Juncus effusus]
MGDTISRARDQNQDGGIQEIFSRIYDQYNSLEQVTDALHKAGLESSNLIVGVDFTKSNEWTGKRSFNGQNLHHISENGAQNPYEQAISIIGKTLSKFDEDNLIPCFGFGDAKTHDKDVFSFYSNGRPCNGFTEALERYRQIVPSIQLSGPTSFAPIIETAINIVQNSGLYHVLLIVADGQVSTSDNSTQLSYQEICTRRAIERASYLPLSIILVGVGDGPWDLAKNYDDKLNERLFDNFQFVNFTEIMSRNISQERKEAQFALQALMEIPSQFNAIQELRLLGQNRRQFVPPPVLSSTRGSSTQVCAVCRVRMKNMVFSCGHETCSECGERLISCLECGRNIMLKAYFNS